MPGDLLFLLVAFAGLLFLAPLRVAMFAKPWIEPGPELRLRSLEDNQATYDVRVGGKTATKFAFALGAIYYGYRAFTGVVEWPESFTSITLVTLVGSCVAGILVAVVWSVVRDRHVLALHPSLGPELVLARRFYLVATLGLPLSLMTGALMLEGIPSIVLAVLGLIAILLIRPLMMKRLVRTQIVIDPASPTAQAISRTVEAFGIQPKRILQSPNLMANAMAFPDGTVMFTTAARAILSDGETAAVVAHELSHVKHGDAKKLVRIQQLAMVIPAFVAGWAVVELQSFGGPDASFLYVLAAIICLIVVMWPLITGIGRRRARRFEFRCDREAAALGHGEALASALVKLHRYGGAPLRWAGLDRLTITHPSLGDRLDALGYPYRAEAPAPVPEYLGAP